MSQNRHWQVLLIGGSSGTGKTVVSKQIGLQLGIPWQQVDDLRLALIHSQATLPEDTEALYNFQAADVWQQPPLHLCKALIALGAVMSPAIEIVVANHVATKAPLILEGDAIQPALFARPEIQQYATGGQLQAVFVIEPEEEILLANMQARGRNIEGQSDAEQRTEAHAKWLYGQYLAQEAQRYGLPIVEPRPWSTLAERILNRVE